MNTLLNQVAAYLWQQSWQLAILIGIASLVCWSLRHKSAHLKYMVWLVVLAKCLVPPIFQMPVALLPAQAMVQSVQTLGLTEFDLEAPGSAPEKTVASETTKASWYNHALVLVERHSMVMTWGVIVILMSVISLFRMIRIRTHLHGHRIAVPQSVQDDLDKVCERFGLARHPNLWLLDQTDQPFVWGWWAGTIYVPDGFESKAPEQRRAILAHELAHVCRYDAAVNLLQVLAQSLFWFHPLVWWANAQTRKAREQCCDEMAIAHMVISAKTYCNALISALNVSRVNPLPLGSLAVINPVKHIEQRIKTIMKETQFRTRPPVMVVLTIVLVALLLISTSCNLCHKNSTEAPIQSEETNHAQEKILIDAFVFECSDEGQEITSIFNKEEIVLSESGVSYIRLTPEQQTRLKHLPSVQVVTSPSTVTKDGMPANMSVITEEYYLLHPSDNSTTDESISQNEFTCIESGIKIDVTPHLNEEHDTIVIDLRLEKSDATPSGRKSGLPIVTRRMASNTLALDKGTSLLIVYTDTNDKITSGVILSAKKVTVAVDQVELTE